MTKNEDARIIIVDEDARVRTNLRNALEKSGYLVVAEVADGLSAVNIVRQLRPDVVLADIAMPGLTGIELAQVLRDERLAPVILITSQTTLDITHQACQAGVLGYLIKPVQNSELAPTIEIARARWTEYCTRRQELIDLKEQLETRAVIERAKGHLMSNQGLRESEAFRKIQKLAMNNRRTMKEVAQAILLAHEIQ